MLTQLLYQRIDFMTYNHMIQDHAGGSLGITRVRPVVWNRGPVMCLPSEQMNNTCWPSSLGTFGCSKDKQCYKSASSVTSFGNQLCLTLFQFTHLESSRSQGLKKDLRVQWEHSGVLCRNFGAGIKPASNHMGNLRRVATSLSHAK